MEQASGCLKQFVGSLPVACAHLHRRGPNGFGVLWQGASLSWAYLPSRTTSGMPPFLLSAGLQLYRLRNPRLGTTIPWDHRNCANDDK